MRQIKLIASDLDGTLLPFGTNEVSQKIFDLIREIRSRKIYFFMASGRQRYQLQNMFKPVADEIGFICDNGCLGILNNEIVCREFMNPDLCDEILREVMNHDEIEGHASGAEGYYLQPKRQKFYDDLVSAGVKVNLVENIFKHPEPYMKLSIHKPHGFSENDTIYWKEKFGSRCNVVTSGAEWLDLMPFGISKASALKKILDRLKIDSSEVIAFGDNENDRDMLEFVGNPVAMKNSKMESIGKFVTENVAKSLRKILDGEFE